MPKMPNIKEFYLFMYRHQWLLYLIVLDLVNLWLRSFWVVILNRYQAADVRQIHSQLI